MRTIERLLPLAVAVVVAGCGAMVSDGGEGDSGGDGPLAVGVGDWDDVGESLAVEDFLQPTIGRVGTVFHLKVLNEKSDGLRPRAVIETAGGSFPFTIDEAASNIDIGRFSLSYTATGDEPEGEHPVRIDLVEGDEVVHLVTLSLTLDFTPPQVTVRWQKPDWQTATRSDATLAFTAVVEVGATVLSVALIDQFGWALHPAMAYTSTGDQIAGASELALEDLSGVTAVAVEVSAVDAAGNASESAASRATHLPVDDDPPSGLELTIGGPDPTPSQVVSIQPQATDASALWLEVTGDVIARPGLPAHVWVPLETEHDVMLTGSSGDKQISVAFRDGAGNEAGPATDNVALDQGEDSSPPDILAPADGAVVTSSTVLLQWTPRLGASSYTVEVWVDHPEVAPVAGSPFTADTAEYEITVTADVTYHWRVRADVTTADQYSSVDGRAAFFDRLGDAVHLYCPAAEPCADSGAVGNLAKPLRTAAGALATAQAHGIDTILIAARGDAEPYTGSIDLVEGISMYGGYTSDFQIQDPVGSVTSILGTGEAALRAIGIEAPTVVEGLTLLGSASLHDAVGLEILVAGDGLLIVDCTIEAGNAGERSFGARIAASQGPQLWHNRIRAGDAPQLSVGLYVHDSHVDLRANRVVAGVSDQRSVGAGGGVNLVNNVLICNTAPFAAAVELDGPATLSNNTLLGLSHGLFLGAGSASSTLTNNLIVVSGAGPRFVIAEHSSDPSPARALEHNALLDLAGGAGLVIYVDQTGRCPSGTDATACTLAEMEALADWSGGADKARGNLELSVGPMVDPLADPCSVEQGTLTDQQWWDLMYGGKDSSGDNCGAPASGPGIGPGGESCGAVDADVDGLERTAELVPAELPSQVDAAGITIGACEVDSP